MYSNTLFHLSNFTRENLIWDNGGWLWAMNQNSRRRPQFYIDRRNNFNSHWEPETPYLFNEPHSHCQSSCKPLCSDDKGYACCPLLPHHAMQDPLAINHSTSAWKWPPRSSQHKLSHNQLYFTAVLHCNVCFPPSWRCPHPHWRSRQLCLEPSLSSGRKPTLEWAELTSWYK